MTINEVLVAALWTMGLPFALVVAAKAVEHAVLHWPKVGEWCERCRRPLEGDPDVGAICEACGPLGPTKAMRRRAAALAEVEARFSRSGGAGSVVIGDLIPEVLDGIAARSAGAATSATERNGGEG